MDLPVGILDDWSVYWSVEPWAEQRADLRIGLQSAQFHKTMTGESLPIDKFLPDFEATPESREREQRERMLQAIKAWEASDGISEE